MSHISSFTSSPWIVSSVYEYCRCRGENTHFTHFHKSSLSDSWLSNTLRDLFGFFCSPSNNNMPHSHVTALDNKYTNYSIAAHLRFYKAATASSVELTVPLLLPAGYVGMQLVPKTTRNPHQIGGMVLRLGAWSSAGCVWGWATGEEGQTAGPVPIPLPGSLRRLDTSVRQKQTSRRAPAQTGVPWQRFRAKVHEPHTCTPHFCLWKTTTNKQACAACTV